MSTGVFVSCGKYGDSPPINVCDAGRVDGLTYRVQLDLKVARNSVAAAAAAGCVGRGPSQGENQYDEVLTVSSYLSPIVSASLTSMPDPDIRPLSNSHTRSPARQIHLTLSHPPMRIDSSSVTYCAAQLYATEEETAPTCPSAQLHLPIFPPRNTARGNKP